MTVHTSKVTDSYVRTPPSQDYEDWEERKGLVEEGKVICLSVYLFIYVTKRVDRTNKTK